MCDGFPNEDAVAQVLHYIYGHYDDTLSLWQGISEAGAAMLETLRQDTDKLGVSVSLGQPLVQNANLTRSSRSHSSSLLTALVDLL